MKTFKILILFLLSLFVLSNCYGQSSPINLMKEIGNLDSDLIIIVNNKTSVKDLKIKIKMVKKHVKGAKFAYKIEDNRIENFEFEGSDQGCASDKFGTFVVAIKNEQVQSCFISDRLE